MPFISHQLFILLGLLSLAMPVAAVDGPDCQRTFRLALHEHGLLYSNQTGTGIDKDFSDELIRRSGCKVTVSVLPRARIWQLIESGALDFSLSGIANSERDKFAGFAWYFSNKYYLLLRKDSNASSLSGFEQAGQLQIGVIRSFRYGASTNQFLDRLSAGQRVSYASGLDPLYQLLITNRIQGMIIEPFDYPSVENTSIRELTMIVDTNDPSVPHGLIMSKQSLSLIEQEKWRELVKGMRSDGTVEMIFRKYFKPELAKSMVIF